MRQGIAIAGRVDHDPLGAAQEESSILLDTEPLDGINDEFRGYVWSRFPEESAWPATASVLGYLEFDELEIELYGVRPANAVEATWRLLISFRSSGGMRGVSNVVAAHWAMRWFDECRDSITAELLEPAGFVPTGEVVHFFGADIQGAPFYEEDVREFPRIICIKREVYAIASDSPDSPLDIDLAILDSRDDGVEPLLAAGEAMLRNTGNAGCPCQLCADSR